MKACFALHRHLILQSGLRVRCDLELRLDSASCEGAFHGGYLQTRSDSKAGGVVPIGWERCRQSPDSSGACFEHHRHRILESAVAVALVLEGAVAVGLTVSCRLMGVHTRVLVGVVNVHGNLRLCGPMSGSGLHVLGSFRTAAPGGACWRHCARLRRG